MDFDYKNPTHIIALFLIVLTFTTLIITPVLSFIGIYPSLDSSEIEKIKTYPENVRIIIEFFSLVLQLAFIFFLFVIVPFMWYKLVNKNKLKDIYFSLKLNSADLDDAIMLGLTFAILLSAVFFLFESILIRSGFNAEELGNIQDLAGIFSPFSLLILLALQPFTEEIFFRGFLLEKIEYLYDKKIAIFVTAILFGFAHLTYDKVYPVILIIIIGIILAYLVYETKNIYASIVAHTTFNLISLTIFLI